MPYLLKTEPDVYSLDDLKRDHETVWDGVTNPQAVMHLRGMKPGEPLVIYHSGGVKSVMGTASVLSVDASDPKVPLVRIRYGKALRTPRSLSDIKGQELFAASPLVRQSRLSVVPLTDAQYAWITGG